ncbi:MAG: hypothetical protein JST04_00530 [Bdellovibrionales bacterium]|nr:hypothetical protein [Bdellovibrionales bacterium]
MTKTLLALAISTLTATSAFAGVEIESLKIVRSGGGQMEIFLSGSGNVINAPMAMIASCGFKDLTPEQQIASAVILKGTDADDITAILANQARIGTDVSPREPDLESGTWLSIEIGFAYRDFSDKVIHSTQKIADPIVAIGGRASSVIANVEKLARANAAAKGLCK